MNPVRSRSVAVPLGPSGRRSCFGVSALAAVAWPATTCRRIRTRVEAAVAAIGSSLFRQLAALIEKYEQLPCPNSERALHAPWRRPGPARSAPTSFSRRVHRRTPWPPPCRHRKPLASQRRFRRSSAATSPTALLPGDLRAKPALRHRTTSRQPGYFHAAPVKRSAPTSPVIGVVTVKVSLQPFEQALARSGEALLVADRDGVIFLSAIPQWKYRVLAPLAPPVAARLAEIQQYSGFPWISCSGKPV